MTDMQDRINELAKQCGIDMDSDTLCRHGGWDEPVRNFAQAIARECAEIVEEHAKALRAMNSKHEAAQAEMAADEIYARFGIAGE